MLAVIAIAAALGVSASLAGQTDAGGRRDETEWRFFGSDSGATRYSPAHQINASNVRDLRLAWRWSARNFGPRESESILAFLTERHGLVNVNVATGEEIVALGLSKKDADTIVSYRTDHGAFADFAALRGVPGLDVERLDAVRQRVAFRD